MKHYLSLVMIKYQNDALVIFPLKKKGMEYILSVK